MEKLHQTIEFLMNNNKVCCILIENLIKHFNYNIRADMVNNDERTIKLDNLYYGSIIIKSYFVKDYDNNKIIEKITIFHNMNYIDYKFSYNGINY
jgi:hypothetical protein